MKTTETGERPGYELTLQEEARCRKRYLLLFQALRAQDGDAVSVLDDPPPLHLTMMADYQCLMRTMVRPTMIQLPLPSWSLAAKPGGSVRHRS